MEEVEEEEEVEVEEVPVHLRDEESEDHAEENILGRRSCNSSSRPHHLERQLR